MSDEHVITIFIAPAVTCKCRKVLTLENKRLGNWEEALMNLHRTHTAHCKEWAEADAAMIAKEMQDGGMGE